MNKQHTNLVYAALIAGALIGSLSSPYLSVANGQLPMDQMSTMNGNETAISQNMTEPQLNLGVVTMPVMCTSLAEIFGLGETFGSIANTTGGGGGGNETEQGILGLGLMSGGALNMTESEMQEIRNVTEGLNWQKIMNSQFCSLVTDEKMIEEMLFSNRTIND